jgi:hypothetical protein
VKSLWARLAFKAYEDKGVLERKAREERTSLSFGDLK